MSQDKVADLARAFGIANADFASVYAAVIEALVAKFGECDGGIGLGYADFHITVGGIEYHLTMKDPRAEH